jgi:hypothetical protein
MSNAQEETPKPVNQPTAFTIFRGQALTRAAGLHPPGRRHLGIPYEKNPVRETGERYKKWQPKSKLYLTSVG